LDVSAFTTTDELAPTDARALDAYRPSLRAWTWRHPEWWVLTLSALAWLETLALMSTRGSHDGSGSAMPGMAMTASAGPAHPLALGASLIGGWTLMVATMMLPLTIGPLRAVAERSLWRRRQRAIAEYVVGFLGVWLLAGAALLVLAYALRALGWSSARTPAWVLPVGLGSAAAWQLTPYKRRALRACHRAAPLAPSGVRAVQDCVRYGASSARSCLASCGIAMVALTLGDASLVAMIVVTGVVLAECYAIRPRATASAALLAAVAAGALLA
jgi:hypothetical protein